MNEGWVILHRKLFDNNLWFLEPFTKAQAWVDLFANANHKEGVISIRGNLVTIKRGQLGWSEITMSKRWQWSRNKVRNFLKWLKVNQQIEQQKLVRLTTITTIINYDKYQQIEQQKDNRRTTEGQQKVQQKVHKQRMINNDNNDKQVVKKIYTPPNLTDKDFSEVAKKYGVSINFVKFQYDKMVTWAESNPNNPKLKGRNWKMTLMTFVRDDSLKIKQDYAKTNSKRSVDLSSL